MTSTAMRALAIAPFWFNPLQLPSNTTNQRRLFQTSHGLLGIRGPFRKRPPFSGERQKNSTGGTERDIDSENNWIKQWNLLGVGLTA